MRKEYTNTKGIATGTTDDPEGQWGTDGGQNQRSKDVRLRRKTSGIKRRK